jgi:PPOX class probable F420-dependent enzyme
MRITGDQARALFAAARVARLATVDPVTGSHLVPIVFAVEDDVIYSAVDAKPKRTTELRRLRNVRADPRVSVLADDYDDRDWARLWWARAEGLGRVIAADDPAARRGVDLLAARYAQYREVPLRGEVLRIDVGRWSGWSASASTAGSG